MQNLVFMIDLDNTILDNDGVKKDIEAKMLEILGERLAARFWFYYEAVRKDIDYIDFYRSVALLREENPADAAAIDRALDAPRWLLGKTWGENSVTLKLEDRFDPAVVQALKDAGHDVELVAPMTSMMGHAGALLRHPPVGLRQNGARRVAVPGTGGLELLQ